MPFSLTYRKSRKSLPRLRAPSRKARLSQNNVTETKPKSGLRKIHLDLGDVTSTLMYDGTWYIDSGRNDGDNLELLRQRQLKEKLCKENEMLTGRNEILFQLAKEKTAELDRLEKELRQLRRILSKSALRKGKGPK